MPPQSSVLCACGCGRPVARLFHRYRRGHKNPGPSLAERLWAKIDKNGPVPSHRRDLGPCWLFTGFVDPSTGRGQIGLGDGTRRLIKAHRAAWLVTHGSIPDGVDVCHHCDVRHCCRPSHLFLGNRAENLADMRAKGRAEDGTRRARGEANPATTISTATVRAIRDARGREHWSTVAVRYGVSRTTVYAIWSGRTRRAD